MKIYSKFSQFNLKALYVRICLQVGLYRKTYHARVCVFIDLHVNRLLKDFMCEKARSAFEQVSCCWQSKGTNYVQHFDSRLISTVVLLALVCYTITLCTKKPEHFSRKNEEITLIYFFLDN